MQIGPVSGHVARCKKAVEIESWRTQKGKTKFKDNYKKD
jgi:hypothetical protein